MAFVRKAAPVAREMHFPVGTGEAYAPLIGRWDRLFILGAYSIINDAREAIGLTYCWCVERSKAPPGEDAEQKAILELIALNDQLYAVLATGRIGLRRNVDV